MALKLGILKQKSTVVAVRCLDKVIYNIYVYIYIYYVYV